MITNSNMTKLQLTANDKKAIIKLFKDYDSYYNANSLSQVLNISRVGTMKILKKLHNNDILISRRIGKSIIYNVNLLNDYARKLIAFLLADEAHEYERWKDEFKDLDNNERIILLYGSVIKNYDKARDIDIMVVLKKEDTRKVSDILDKRRKLLAKPLHDIKLSEDDFIKNVKIKKPAIINTIKTSVVLFGQDKYVELIKNVTSI